MLIEVGPRTIGKCEFKYADCSGKGFSIVKKVLLAKEGHTIWVCHSCMMEKLKFDREDTNLRPNPMKEMTT